MEAPQPPPIDSTSSEATSMSLTDRLTDIFFSPGEVFDEIKAGPPKAMNWVIPLILAVVVGAISGIVVFSQPAVIQQIHQIQAQQYAKMVKQGKMTEKQAADIQEKTEQFMGPTFFKITAVVASVFLNPARLFLVGLFAWLLARYAFHAQVNYMQAVEMAGLSTLISIVGVLVSTLLIASFGDTLATASPALLLDHRDVANKVHVTLSKFDLFDLWFAALVSYGVARMSGVQWFKPALWLFAIWALFTIGPIWAFNR